MIGFSTSTSNEQQKNVIRAQISRSTIHRSLSIVWFPVTTTLQITKLTLLISIRIICIIISLFFFMRKRDLDFSGLFELIFSTFKFRWYLLFTCGTRRSKQCGQILWHFVHSYQKSLFEKINKRWTWFFLGWKLIKRRHRIVLK